MWTLFLLWPNKCIRVHFVNRALGIKNVDFLQNIFVHASILFDVLLLLFSIMTWHNFLSYLKVNSAGVQTRPAMMLCAANLFVDYICNSHLCYNICNIIHFRKSLDIAICVNSTEYDFKK